MIFVDSNIPMYAAGAPSKYKEACLSFLEKISKNQVEGVSSSEVLQEILHRYRAINKIDQGFKVYDAFRMLPLRFVEVLLQDVDFARHFLETKPKLSSRDALHIAVMKRLGIKKIMTYDQGFWGIEKITVCIPD